MRVDIWSDVVCPWCYVGKRRFETAVAAMSIDGAIEVVHRSFQLNPAAPAGHTSSRREMLMAKYRLSPAQVEAIDAKMQETAAVDGLEFRLGPAGRTGNTAHAHALVHLARDKGVQDAMVERLYRAYFTEERSVFDDESLAALAADAGLDADEARQVLRDGTYAAAVRADGEAARALGATGVPFFVFDNRYGVSGAQPVDVFVDALTRAQNAKGEAGARRSRTPA
jgi:predicted DsbA family dithiol-disulfide isomerase